MLSNHSAFDSLLPNVGSMRSELLRSLREVNSLHGSSQKYNLCPVSMWQTEEAIHIEADVPSLNREDLKIQFEDSRLWIRGERKWSNEEKLLEYNERYFGTFERSISLPDSVDPSRIEADLNEGVLHITVMKKPEALPRSIEIKHQADGPKNITDHSKEE